MKIEIMRWQIYSIYTPRKTEYSINPTRMKKITSNTINIIPFRLPSGNTNEIIAEMITTMII